MLDEIGMEAYAGRARLHHGRNPQLADAQDKTAPAEEQADEALQRFTDGFSWLRRSPVLHSPSEHGLAYEDVTFPARDGVPPEGWFIPAPGSGKLIIANHPMRFSRSGIPTHLQPWHADWAASGNGFEVDLVPDYKIMHDVGYNVLAYDLRNHGLSSAANGGVSRAGSPRAGTSPARWSTRASARHPRHGDRAVQPVHGRSLHVLRDDALARVVRRGRCLVSPQLVTTRLIVERRLAVMGPGGRLEGFNTLVRLRSSVGLEQRIPQQWAKSVHVPTFLYQVRGDILTDPSDVQAMFDNLPVAEKKLQWIESTTARWGRLPEFQRRPQPMLDWFARYMS